MSGDANGSSRGVWQCLSKPRQAWLRGLVWGSIGIVFAATVGYFEVGTSERLRELRLLGQHVDRLQLALLDCETGLRAYLVTSERKFLESQLGCKTAAEHRIGKIQDLSKATSPDLDHDGLGRAAWSVLTDIGQAVIAIDDGRHDAVVALPAMERGKGLMDDARRSISAFQDKLDAAEDATYLRKHLLHAFEMRLLLVLLTTAGMLHASARRAAKQLAGRLELERAIWRSSGDAMFLYDVETGKIIDVNPRGCDLLGLSAAKIIGEVWTRFMPGHEMPRAQAHVAQVGAKPQGPILGNLLTADGREVPIEASISAEIAMNGNRFAVSSFRHLGARETALREAAFRKAIEETMPSGLAVVSDAGEQTYVNDRLCQMVGWSKDDLIGKQPPFVYWPPEDADRIRAVFQDAVAGKIGPAGAEITLMRKSGERFPVQVLVARIAYERNPGWLAIVIDVSERKQTETALDEARRLESIGQLAGQVAHDFNNLLTIITMNTAIMRQSHGSAAALAEPLADMANAAKRGTSITRTLLAVARRQSLAPEPVELTAHLDELKPLLTTTCGPNVALVLQAPPSPIWVIVDGGGLSGALLNLVVNARDAMPGGGTVGIRLSVKMYPDHRTHAILSPGAYAVIEVWDTGHGMPAEVRRRAFDPFFSTKGRVGSGLGLASVYGFARQSGGLAEIESEPGRGTTVRLSIPVIEAPAGEVKREIKSATPAVGYRVLLVDDEADLLKALAELLRQSGHAVTTASDGQTALATLATQDFDILLSDILMPGMGGVALAEQAAKQHPRLCIALMTGFGMRPPEEALPWEIVEKPFDPDGITALFERICSKSTTAG